MNPNSHATSWIVTLQPGSSLALTRPGLAKTGRRQVGHTYSHALHGFEFKGSAQAASSLKHNPNVRTVQASIAPVHLPSETVPPGIKRIRADHPTQPDAARRGLHRRRRAGRDPRHRHRPDPPGPRRQHRRGAWQELHQAPGRRRTATATAPTSPASWPRSRATASASSASRRARGSCRSRSSTTRATATGPRSSAASTT